MEHCEKNKESVLKVKRLSPEEAYKLRTMNDARVIKQYKVTNDSQRYHLLFQVLCLGTKLKAVCPIK